MNYDWLEVMIGLEVAIGLRTKDLNIFTLRFALGPRSLNFFRL